LLLDWNIADVHAHLLPALDDGPADAATALRMCRIYQDEGVRTVVATPHMSDPRYPVSAQDVREGVLRLTDACRRQGIRLDILPGADVRLQPEILDDLDAGRLLTLADGGRFLLLELPPQSLPPMHWLLPALSARGIVPILTHPERHPVLCGSPRRLKDLVERGCLTQVTGASLLGWFGRGPRRAVEEFLRLGLVHMVASDAHAPEGPRRPQFGALIERLIALVGAEGARELLCRRPGALLSAARRAGRPAEVER